VRTGHTSRERAPGGGAALKWVAVWLLGASALLSPALRADDSSAKPPPPTDDTDLFEFLGTIGSVNEKWLEYLARTDPTKVKSAPRPPAQGQTPDAAATDSSGSQKK